MKKPNLYRYKILVVNRFIQVVDNNQQRAEEKLKWFIKYVEHREPPDCYWYISTIDLGDGSLAGYNPIPIAEFECMRQLFE